MKTKELIRKAALPTVLIVALANTACGDDEPRFCRSPRVTSPTYPGVTPPDDQKWGAGIIVRTTNIPGGSEYRGLVVDFYNPEDVQSVPQESHPVPGERGKEVALYIGSGTVGFGVQFEAKIDSKICDTTPATEFGSAVPFDQLPSAPTRPTW